MHDMPMEVLLTPEVKSKLNKSNLMPKAIGLQEVQSIGQIFFLQASILCGIIPSPSDLISCLASCFLIGYNPLNLILLVVTCNDVLSGAFWHMLLFIVTQH